MGYDNIIETFDLCKEYKLKRKGQTILALKDINLKIKRGEIFGLLGPNGAGKTTMIQILTSLIQPTSGYATIDGINIVKSPKTARQKVSLMLENKMLYGRLTGYSNLKFFCRLYNVEDYDKKIGEITKEFGLEKWLNEWVGSYSSGMRMKLALCRTLLLNRSLAFLDEPTLGIDVKTRSFILEKLKNSHNTIFITSHDMNVVEQLCDRIAFIEKGKIIKVGTKSELSKLLQSELKIYVKIKQNFDKLKAELLEEDIILQMIEIKDKSSIITLKDRNYYNQFIRILFNYDILKIKEIEPSLEEIFLKIYE